MSLLNLFRRFLNAGKREGLPYIAVRLMFAALMISLTHTVKGMRPSTTISVRTHLLTHIRSCILFDRTEIYDKLQPLRGDMFQRYSLPLKTTGN